MSAQSFRSFVIKFSFLSLLWGPACSATDDPAAEEDSSIGSASGKGGSGGKSGSGKGGRGGSSSGEAGAPSIDGEAGMAGSATDPPASSGSGGEAGAAEPGRGGSSGGADSGTGGSTSPAAGDSGMSRGGEPGEEEPEPGTGGGPDGTAGRPGGTAGRPGEEPDSEAVLRGKALAEENLCVACHQDDYAGLGFYPNLTPDVATGLGDWADVDIANAIQNGYDKNGESLCSLMTIYPFTNEETADIVSFLRQLPVVSNEITAMCPGHGQ